MNRFLVTVFIVFMGLVDLWAEPKKSTEGSWVQLFNGKDLSGWTPKFAKHPLGKNLNGAFRVRDGKLVVDYSDWTTPFNGEFGHLYFKTPYSHYRLRATYRFIGEQIAGGQKWAIRNNGLMVHCQDPKTLELNQEFPNSIEIQLLGGLKEGEERATLNACTPGTQVVVDGKLIKPHVIPSNGPTFYGDQWVTVEAEIRGDRIKHIVNGKVVLEYTDVQLDDGTPLTGGYISIQAETHPIEFKSIEILPLEGPNK